MNDDRTMHNPMPVIDTSTLGPIRLSRLVVHDPGSPPYERARALLVTELRALGMAEDADYLEQGELYSIEPWIALQIIARLL